MLHRSTAAAVLAALFAIPQVGGAQEPLAGRGRVPVLPAETAAAPPREPRSEEENWSTDSVREDPDAALEYWRATMKGRQASAESLKYLNEIASTYKYREFEGDAIETYSLFVEVARGVPAYSRAAPSVALAASLRWFGRTEDAFELLSQVLERYPNTSYRASIIESLADYHSELEHFDRADALYAQLFEEVGDRYRGRTLVYHWKRQGKWNEALEYWEQYEVMKGGCGQGTSWLLSEKMQSTMLCLFELGRFDEVVARLRPVVFEDSSHGQDREIALTLIEAHRALGSLDALVSELEERVPPGKLPMTILQIARVQRLAALGDADGLCRFLLAPTLANRQRSTYSPVRYYAFERLMENPWMARVAAERCEGYELNPWVTTVLAATQNPLALLRIEQAIPGDRDEDLELRLYGLVLLGTPEAYALLRGFLEHERPAVSAAAEVMLRRYVEGRPIGTGIAPDLGEFWRSW